MVRAAFRRVLALSVAALAAGCSFIVDSDLGNGIGAQCQSDGDCQGSTCDSDLKLCVKPCTSNGDCPTPTTCAQGKCQRPLSVGVLFIGNVGEGWTETHAAAFETVSQQLQYLRGLDQLRSDLTTQGVTPGDGAKKKIQQYVDEKRDVIIATSASYSADVAPFAAAHPEIKFLDCEGSSINDTNLGSYYGKREEAWFVAGQVAAQALPSSAPHLGMIGSYISPDTVRNINAFTLGARSVKPDAIVEVRWTGFWFDYRKTYDLCNDPGKDPPPPEYDQPCSWTCKHDCDANGENCVEEECDAPEFQAQALMDHGAEIIAHQLDDSHSVKWIEAHQPQSGDVLSIGNNNQNACAGHEQTCLLSVYWNWTTLYTKLFTEMHRGVWKPSFINEDLNSQSSVSLVGVQFNDKLSGAGIDNQEVTSLVAKMAQDPGQTFRGPYNILNGQRGFYSGGTFTPNDVQAIAAGAVPDDNEIRTMCWFVEGVKQRYSGDSDLVDATVPVDDSMRPEGAVPPLGGGFNCRTN